MTRSARAVAVAFILNLALIRLVGPSNEYCTDLQSTAIHLHKSNSGEMMPQPLTVAALKEFGRQGVGRQPLGPDGFRD